MQRSPVPNFDVCFSSSPLDSTVELPLYVPVSAALGHLLTFHLRAQVFAREVSGLPWWWTYSAVVLVTPKWKSRFGQFADFDGDPERMTTWGTSSFAQMVPLAKCVNWCKDQKITIFSRTFDTYQLLFTTKWKLASEALGPDPLKEDSHHACSGG